MFEVGAGKADITVKQVGVGMMGYGMFRNIVLGVDAPIYARAFVFRDNTTGKKICFVNAEICFITIAIKRGVAKKLLRKNPELGYDQTNLFLTAQHTHSAPGGYSQYGLYNMSIPGFVPEVYQGVVDGIVEAIIQADANLKPAKLRLGTGSFDASVDIAFNRSLDAYNANPEVLEKIPANKTELAVNREMTLLRVDDEQGKPMASINWFGVHTTSISNDNHKISGDNKGFAAKYLEDEIAGNSDGFLAAFAQEACGDITPNYIWDEKKKWTRGRFEDDFESAKYNGKLQFEKALEIFKEAGSAKEIEGSVDSVLTYVDFRNLKVDPEFANGDQQAMTGSSCHGVAFFLGTTEGPGMAPVVGALAKFLARIIKRYEYLKGAFLSSEERKRIQDKYKVQGKKDILIETGDRKILGTRNVKRLIIPGWADRNIKVFKEYHKNGSLDDKPWIPQVLPLHLAVIGNIAIAGIPAEMTTIAGKRLNATLLDVLKQRGVERVIISPYANAYCGYITTYEEYQLQKYEGGHTVYGEHTLGAFQTKFKELANQLLKAPEDRDDQIVVEPVKFTEDEIQKRTFDIRTQQDLIPH